MILIPLVSGEGSKGGRTQTTWKLLNLQQRVVAKAIALRVVFLQQSVLVFPSGFTVFTEPWTAFGRLDFEGLQRVSFANLVQLFY